MKIPASKLTLAVSALAVACLFTAPAVDAAERSAEKSANKSATGAEKSSNKSANKSDTAAAKQQEHEENLQKYDKNGNGKLDPDERAAMRADQEKAKAKKSPKNKKQQP